MANKGRVFFGFSDAWTKNELAQEQRDLKEAHYEGWEKAPKSKRGPQQVEWHDNPALGLDGSEFHMGGERVTNTKEERNADGSFNVYFQNVDSGGTYVTRWEQTAERGFTQVTRPRRVRSF